MEEKIFEEFIEWVKDLVDDKIGRSAEYKAMLRSQSEISEKISERLGGSQMLEEYINLYAVSNGYYEYILCETMLKLFVQLLSFSGVIK